MLREAGIEDIYVTPLVCAVQARVALHRGDVPAVRRELVSAQRLRHLLTYAVPHVAVQVRIELTRVHLALADLAGARTLMGEIDELLQRLALIACAGSPPNRTYHVLPFWLGVTFVSSRCCPREYQWPGSWPSRWPGSAAPRCWGLVLRTAAVPRCPFGAYHDWGDATGGFPPGR